jgi:hypothetical protein
MTQHPQSASAVALAFMPALFIRASSSITRHPERSEGSLFSLGGRSLSSDISRLEGAPSFAPFVCPSGRRAKGGFLRSNATAPLFLAFGSSLLGRLFVLSLERPVLRNPEGAF